MMPDDPVFGRRTIVADRDLHAAGSQSGSGGPVGEQDSVAKARALSAFAVDDCC
jgi:hypothetical protein